MQLKVRYNKTDVCTFVESITKGTYEPKEISSILSVKSRKIWNRDRVARFTDLEVIAFLCECFPAMSAEHFKQLIYGNYKSTPVSNQ